MATFILNLTSITSVAGPVITFSSDLTDGVNINTMTPSVDLSTSNAENAIQSIINQAIISFNINYPLSQFVIGDTIGIVGLSITGCFKNSASI